MKYIVFDISTQARRQLAFTCARQLHKLQTPHWDSSYITQYANSIYRSGTWKGDVFTPDNQWGAIAFDENEQIPLRTNYPDGTDRGNGYEHIRQWIKFRFPDGTALELTQAQFDWIKNWVINNDTATIEQLMLENGGTPANLPALPNFINIRTQAQFDTLQWEKVR